MKESNDYIVNVMAIVNAISRDWTSPVSGVFRFGTLPVTFGLRQFFCSGASPR